MTSWRDWAVIGLRCGFLVFAALVLFGSSADPGVIYPQNDTLVLLIIGAFSTIVLVVPTLFPALRRAFEPALAIGDWIIMALLVSTTRADPLLMVTGGAILIVSSAFRLGTAWGIVQVIGIVTAVWITGNEVLRQQGSAVGVDWLPIAALIAVGLAAHVWAYLYQRQVSVQQTQLREEEAAKSSQLRDMSARTRAIYEMAAVLGTTLNTDRILEAAMNAGWLGLRSRASDAEERLVSAVLLFRSADNQLAVKVSRGLTRTDEARSTPGVNGAIGEALRQCIPIFAGHARKDPELGNFVAFQNIRSVMCIPLRAGYDNFGVMVFGSVQPDAFTDEHTELLSSIGTQATIALQNAHLYQNLMQERDRLLEADEEARKKLARDLHDGPTQDIAAIAMRMGIIQKLLERSPHEVPSELKKIEELARKTTKEIRHMLFTQRPLVLENQGLKAALGQLRDKMKETYNQALAVRVNPDAERALDTGQQGVIFQIIEEAVGNARKHAQAQLISILVNKQDDMVWVSVTDDGVGFDARAAEARSVERGGHLGMINLRERAEMVDGRLTIESAPGKGTSITLLVPIKDGQRPAGDKTPLRVPSGKTTKLEAAAVERLRQSPDH
jgi:signal transduction histidine kinase